MIVDGKFNISLLLHLATVPNSAANRFKSLKHPDEFSLDFEKNNELKKLLNPSHQCRRQIPFGSSD